MGHAANRDLQPNVMLDLQDMIMEHHQYHGLYKQAFEILQEKAAQNPEQAVDLYAHLHFDGSMDRRTHNRPTSNEVAAILPGDGSEAATYRDIVLRLHGGGLESIKATHPAYLPLHYVLLFSRGENGWDPEIPLVRQGQADDDDNDGDQEVLREENQELELHRGCVTQLQWYAYRLHPRNTEASTIFQAGKLFQQFMVDAWAQMEESHLNWIRFNQRELRAEVYNGLADAVQQDAGLNLNNVGSRFILPSSFIGGQRHMQQCFQDSMAIVRKYFNPDLFITMTANPKWPEVLEAIRQVPHCSDQDQADIITHVFQLKYQALVNDFIKNGIAGRTVAHVYTIEFQKRGLPHVHILIFLHPDDKIHNPNDIDLLIRAEFPNPDMEPLLFDTVLKCMTHGPCGDANPNAPCMDNGRCTKPYPKPYQEETNMDGNGYPKYRHRNDGRSYMRNGHRYTNQDVIPYCPYLSAKYDCHINVEIAVTVKAVKYIHKYIYKGHDRTTMVVEGPVDEIKRYIDARYVSSCEAVWRLFRF